MYTSSLRKHVLMHQNTHPVLQHVQRGRAAQEYCTGRSCPVSPWVFRQQALWSKGEELDIKSGAQAVLLPRRRPSQDLRRLKSCPKGGCCLENVFTLQNVR